MRTRLGMAPAGYDAAASCMGGIWPLQGSRPLHACTPAQGPAPPLSPPSWPGAALRWAVVSAVRACSSALVSSNAAVKRWRVACSTLVLICLFACTHAHVHTQLAQLDIWPALWRPSTTARLEKLSATRTLAKKHNHQAFAQQWMPAEGFLSSGDSARALPCSKHA